MPGDQPNQSPLIVHIEGNVKTGVSTVVKELSHIQPPGCNVHYLHEVKKHPFQSIVGDLRWTVLKESNKGMGACLIELTAYLQQRYKINIPPETNMIIMDRSLGSLQKVFNSTNNVMILRELEDSIALNALYEALDTYLEKPHMVIYLESDKKTLENRIKQAKGSPIDSETLEDINRLYEDYLKSKNPNIPILRLSTINETLDQTVARAYMGISELYCLDKISEYL